MCIISKQTILISYFILFNTAHGDLDTLYIPAHGKHSTTHCSPRCQAISRQRIIKIPSLSLESAGLQDSQSRRYQSFNFAFAFRRPSQFRPTFSAPPGGNAPSCPYRKPEIMLGILIQPDAYWMPRVSPNEADAIFLSSSRPFRGPSAEHGRKNNDAARGRHDFTADINEALEGRGPLSPGPFLESVTRPVPEINRPVRG